MPIFELGEPWPGDDDLVAAEGLGWHADVGLVLLVVPGLSDIEIDGLRGPLDVALVAHESAVGLMFRFDGFPDWMLAWSWRRFDLLPDDLLVDAPDSDSRVALTLVAVDQRSKIVQVIRSFTLSPHLSQVLRREVDRRWQEPTADATAIGQVQRWYDAHPTGRSGLRDAIARCKAGQ